MLAGQVIVGGWLSTTVTAKLQEAVLPEASVAVQVTVLVPLANVLPLVGLQLTVTPEQLSVAVGVKLTIWLHWPSAVLVTRLSGQARIGATLSLTATVKLQFAVLPEASVAVQVTLLVPLLKVEPLGGRQTLVTPEQLSLTVGAA